MNRALLVLLAACTTEVATEPDALDGFPDFDEWGDCRSGGKCDTGYVGNRAAELEAVFSGRVFVALPDKTAAERETIAEALRTNPDSWEHRDVTNNVTQQIKYARNALKAERLNLNLEGGTPAFTSVQVVDDGLELVYTLAVESLVKFKDLEAQGLTPQDLVGRVIMPRLPRVPAGLFERVGNKCATDPDNGMQPTMEDLRADNLFFYWDPARAGCPLGENELVTGEYRVDSSLDAATVYPEYDRLVADGRVDMQIIFGQITHGELASNDWGFISYRAMRSVFGRMGFRVVEEFAGNTGSRLEKRYAGGLVVGITMWTPIGFADSVPRDEANQRFRDAIRASEVFYYNGHAFYGSLNVLDDPSVYPADRYQILFMDACWSYAYYTKQIFRNRATATDPDGYALVDVVNNTEPGITGSEHTAAVLYDNLFKGAAAVHSRGNASRYSWNALTQYMNDHAEQRARARAGSDHPNPEIYGASGVRDNVWQPGGVMPPPPPMGRRFETTTAVDVPDNDMRGATSTLTVPAGTGNIAGQIMIQVDVTHTYIGDLRVTVEHGGKTVVLHDNAGGSNDDLHLVVPTTEFAGTSADGEWKLLIVDSAAQDLGRLTRFAIALP